MSVVDYIKANPKDSHYKTAAELAAEEATGTGATTSGDTPIEVISRMSDDDIAGRIYDIIRVRRICESIVKQENHGVSNPPAAGQLLNILMADVAHGMQTTTPNQTTGRVD